MSLLIVVAFLLHDVSEVTSQCPPSSGIYLMHNGDCYPNGSYFYDDDIRPEQLICSLPSTTLTGGEWVTPSGSSVDCNTDPLRCIVESAPNATISLYIPFGQGISSSDDGWYKCCLPTSCSDPSTNIIFANIFKWGQIEDTTVDLPSDVTVLPQTYTLHAIKIGHQNQLNTNSADWYYNQSSGNSIKLCRGYNDEYSCSIGNGVKVNYGNGRCDYTLTITWNEENITSGVSNDKNDLVYMFYLELGQVTRYRYITVKVPATAPSSLTEVSKTATTITVSWAALDSSDADGYVVNATNNTDTVQTVLVEGSNNKITLNGLRGGTTYSITVRAYQQLLGPASTISVQTSVINSINWALVSSITQLNHTKYRIDCITATNMINPSTDVYWLVNGVMESNSMYTSLDVLTYNNTLLVYPDPLGVSVNVTCIAMTGGVSYSHSVILHAPSGPPNNVRGFILNTTSIKVNWTNSSETNGYVIEYTTGGVTRNVVSTSEDEIELTDLSPMSTYTISVYSYIDLPSGNSTGTVLRIDVPSPVASLSVSNFSTTGITVNWTIPSSGNYVTYYTISYTPSCPQLSSVNETVSVAPHQSTTTYSYTLTGLYSGMNYTITVTAGSVLGGSNSSIISAKTPLSIPVGAPSSLHVNSNTNRIKWNEINCSQLGGRFVEYNVLIENIYLNELVFGAAYNISVAAVNPVGRGPFSDPIVVEIGASNICDTSNEGCATIGLAITVALLMILLAISLVVHVYCFIKLMYPTIIETKRSKSTAKDENKIMENITMKECESYGLHELGKAVVYEECLPADNQFPVVNEPTAQALYN